MTLYIRRLIAHVFNQEGDISAHDATALIEENQTIVHLAEGVTVKSGETIAINIPWEPDDGSAGT